MPRKIILNTINQINTGNTFGRYGHIGSKRQGWEKQMGLILGAKEILGSLPFMTV